MKIEFAVFGAIAAVVVLLSLVNLDVRTSSDSSLPLLGKAPEFAEITNWINSEPLTMQELRGKVVMVDFWTYSCINCIRTLPYLRGWHDKYGDDGLVIVGIHTPEFEFEKSAENVQAAVERYSIEYPVGQDNNYATWRAYKNNYWPRKYLVDKDGSIRYDHIGEGGYEETEKAIVALLNEAGSAVGADVSNTSSDVDFSQIGTPELYLGYDFARQPLGNLEGFKPDQVVDYAKPSIEKANTIYLSGKWKNERDRVTAVEKSKVFLIYKAKDVNIVAGGPAQLNLLLDDWIVNGTALGDDAYIESFIARVNITEKKLYSIISTPGYEIHLLEIDAQPGFELYTFTFG